MLVEVQLPLERHYLTIVVLVFQDFNRLQLLLSSL